MYDSSPTSGGDSPAASPADHEAASALAVYQRALEQSNLFLTSITYNLPQLVVIFEEKTSKALYTNFIASVVSESNECFLGELAKSLHLRENHPHPGQAVEFICKSGSKRLYYSATSYPLLWGGKPAVAYLLQDISADIKRATPRGRMASLDKVSNRLTGMMTLNKWLDIKPEFILCIANLDNLRHVNTSYSREEGDHLIACAAAHLVDFSPLTHVSRLGGDEFLLLIPDCALAEVEQRLDDIRKQLQDDIRDKPYYCNVSYGVVEVISAQVDSASSLLSLADERMQEAKFLNKKNRMLSQ